MKISSFSISSTQLLIRNYKLSDADALFGLVDSNKKLLQDYFPMTLAQNTSVMASRKYILSKNAERRAGNNLYAGIFTNDGKQLIGQICAKDINWRIPKCEAGYFLSAAFQGKGLGREALNVFSSYCFETLDMQKITLRIEPKNSVSKKLAANCGFGLIGVAKNDFRSSEGRLMECELWERVK